MRFVNMRDACRLAVGVAVGLLWFAGAAAEGIARSELASVGADGSLGNYASGRGTVSADGMFVAFSSLATNLVPGDANGREDVFVRDRVAGATQRVSLGSAGEEGNSDSRDPSLSADGRFVAFKSDASNLVFGDTNSASDIFVHDRLTGTTQRVSVSSSGEQADRYSYWPCISGDGRFVAFASDATNLVTDDMNGRRDIFVHDTQSGTTDRVSISIAGEEANAPSSVCCGGPSISADGRFVAFHSPASNLVLGDANGHEDVFVRDRVADTTELISVSSAGQRGNYDSVAPSISADGRFVAFKSGASNLVPLDTNGVWDVFLRDRAAGTTVRVSVSSGGAQGNGNCYYEPPSISADGRFVAFMSDASNLTPGDTNGYYDVFVRDMLLQTTEAVSISSAGEQGNSYSGSPSISADGRFVAFTSWASNLVPGDTNAEIDVFVRTRWPEDLSPDTAITFGPCDVVISADSAIVCWTGSDAEFFPASLLYSWRLDSGAWQPFSPATCGNLTGLSDGLHLFEVKAKDLAGNEDATPAQCQFTVDIAAPTVSITSPLHGATVKGVVDISASAADPGGVEKVEFSAGGALLSTDFSAPYSYSWDTRPMSVAEGLTALFATAYANNGKVAWTHIRVNVDNTTFNDVGKTSSIWPYVEAIARAAITAGCSTSPPLYCPTAEISRAQMAVFLCRAAGKGPLDRETPTFCDVPRDNPYYAWIERLADPDSWGGNPPTIGCTAFPCKQYCPSQSVTRDEMAAFLVRATGKQPMPSCSGVFADVGAYWACPYIERLADPASWGGTAVTAGCATNPARYCPKAAVTRGQMAVFLVRAFGIAL